jgi:hypothetical protein
MREGWRSVVRRPRQVPFGRARSQRGGRLLVFGDDAIGADRGGKAGAVDHVPWAHLHADLARWVLQDKQPIGVLWRREQGAQVLKCLLKFRVP